MRLEMPRLAMTKSLVTGPGTASVCGPAVGAPAAGSLVLLPLPATSCKNRNASVLVLLVLALSGQFPKNFFARAVSCCNTENRTTPFS
jgi:hypothetical protein